MTAPSQPPLSPPAPTTAYAHFGDSVTCGAGASSLANGFAALLDATVAGPNANFCNDGDQAADTALLVYSNANPTTRNEQTYTLMTGTNDVWLCGPSAGCLANATQELTASLAWLALPQSDKVSAQTVLVRSGAWANDDAVRPGLGLASSQQGAALTFYVDQVVAGRQLYLAWLASDGSAARASLAIDGSQVDTLAAYGNDGVPIHTQHGVASTVFLKAYPLGAAGRHRVDLTVLANANAGDAFTFLWSGVASATYTQTGIPHVLAGGILAENYGLRSDWTAAYDALVQGVVQQLRADGLDVHFVATHDVLTAPEDYYDILHPNDAGHKKIETAFLNAQP